MQILVLSDTHVESVAQLPEQLIDDIQAADAVIHAGDFDEYEVYTEIKEISRLFYAVQGNNDIYFPLPLTLVQVIGGVTIGITHGHLASGDVVTYLSYMFDEYCPNIVIYGHSHIPSITTVNNTIYLNPGSPTRNRRINYNSYAIMQIEDEQVLSINIIEMPK